MDFNDCYKPFQIMTEQENQYLKEFYEGDEYNVIPFDEIDEDYREYLYNSIPFASFVIVSEIKRKLTPVLKYIADFLNRIK